MSFETWQVLLGHQNGGITALQHCGNRGIDWGGEPDRCVAIGSGSHDVAGAKRQGRCL